jgi:hypothetical protein
VVSEGLLVLRKGLSGSAGRASSSIHGVYCLLLCFKLEVRGWRPTYVFDRARVPPDFQVPFYWNTR